MTNRKSSGYVVEILEPLRGEVDGKVYQSDTVVGIVRSGPYSFFVETEGVFTWVPIEFGGTKSVGMEETPKDEGKLVLIAPYTGKYSELIADISNTGGTEPLETFIRSFGSRLEGNYATFVSFLNRVATIPEEEGKRIVEQRLKVDNAVNAAIEAVCGYPVSFIFDDSPRQKVKDALCNVWREANKGGSKELPPEKDFYPDWGGC